METNERAYQSSDIPNLEYSPTNWDLAHLRDNLESVQHTCKVARFISNKPIYTFTRGCVTYIIQNLQCTRFNNV